MQPARLQQQQQQQLKRPTTAMKDKATKNIIKNHEI